MASNFALGFAKGFGQYGANRINSNIEMRQQEESDLRKAKMLEELRQQQADIEYNRSLGEIDDRLTEQDFTNGTTSYYNKRGQKIKDTPMSQAERDAYTQKRTAGDLQLEEIKGRISNQGLEAANMRSEISSRAHDDRVADARLGLERASLQGTTNSGLHGTTPYGGDPEQAAAAKLMDLYKDEVRSVQMSHMDPETKERKPSYLDTVAIRAAALDIVRNSRTGAEADKRFNEWLIRANRGKVGTGKGAYSLDSNY
jgi:antitoxin component HigA of HigAB toxin-antitoxin module